MPRYSSAGFHAYGQVSLRVVNRRTLQIVADLDKRAAAQKEILEQSVASAKVEKEKLVQNFKDGLAKQQAQLCEKEAALKLQVRVDFAML